MILPLLGELSPHYVWTMCHLKYYSLKICRNKQPKLYKTVWFIVIFYLIFEMVLLCSLGWSWTESHPVISSLVWITNVCYHGCFVYPVLGVDDLKVLNILVKSTIELYPKSFIYVSPIIWMYQKIIFQIFCTPVDEP